MAILLLAGILVISMILIPLGMPGTWIMVAAAFGYELLVPDGGIHPLTVIGTAVLAAIAEALEFTLSARFTRRYGGSKRAGWFAILGGMVGAFVGVPVPVVGPVLGALAGSFVGALAGELSRGSGGGVATRVATGALVGRVAAAAMKIAIGMVILVWILVAAVV